jgi:hypothetical protein
MKLHRVTLDSTEHFSERYGNSSFKLFGAVNPSWDVGTGFVLVPDGLHMETPNQDLEWSQAEATASAEATVQFVKMLQARCGGQLLADDPMYRGKALGDGEYIPEDNRFYRLPPKPSSEAIDAVLSFCCLEWGGGMILLDSSVVLCFVCSALHGEGYAIWCARHLYDGLDNGKVTPKEKWPGSAPNPSPVHLVHSPPLRGKGGLVADGRRRPPGE